MFKRILLRTWLSKSLSTYNSCDGCKYELLNSLLSQMNGEKNLQTICLFIDESSIIICVTISTVIKCQARSFNFDFECDTLFYKLCQDQYNLFSLNCLSMYK